MMLALSRLLSAQNAQGAFFSLPLELHEQILDRVAVAVA